MEKVLLGSLVLVPVTGLLLVATGDDWLVLRHTVLRPNRHLSRMV